MADGKRTMRKVLIIGDPNSIFPREQAAIWASHGIEVGIVARRWSGGPLPDGTPVLASAAHESPLQKWTYRVLQKILERVEELIMWCQRDRYERALSASRGSQWYRPKFTPPIINALSISRLVRSIKPDLVCGQEAFANGLATAWCWGIPRLLMTWGGDIYIYCETTTMASRMVTYALRHVDLVIAGAVSSIPYLESRFGLRHDHIEYSGVWQLDRAQFRRASDQERKEICCEFGIAPEALVVMNVRRFWPAWGSDIALEAFVQFAALEPAAHFVLLGGKGTEPYTEAARQRLHAAGLGDRFVILDGDQPIGICAKLMSIADIYVSLMQERDMRSASVLQASAAGGAPIISDQPEYRCMEEKGFRALFVKADDVISVISSLGEYAQNPDLRRSFVSANYIYLTIHEDHEAETRRLIHRAEQICKLYKEKGARRKLLDLVWRR